MNHFITYYKKGFDIGNEVKVASTTLSTEDFGVYIKAINNIFLNKINKIASFFKETVNINKELININNPTEIAKGLILKKKELILVLEKANMNKYGNMTFPVTQGLKLNLPMTLKILQESLAIIDSNLIKYLSKTEKIISDMYSNKDSREIVRLILEDKEYKKNISILYNNLNTMIDSTGTIDRKKLSDIVPNISSIEDVYNTLLNISTKISVNNLKELNSYVERISAKTNTLYEYLSSNKLDRITKESIDNLANYLEDGAKFISYTVSTYYIYYQCVDILTMILVTIYNKETN